MLELTCSAHHNHTVRRNYANRSSSAGEYKNNAVTLLRDERGTNSTAMTEAVNKALKGEMNEKRVLPQMNLCACIIRVSDGFSGSASPAFLADRR